MGGDRDELHFSAAEATQPLRHFDHCAVLGETVVNLERPADGADQLGDLDGVGQHACAGCLFEQLGQELLLAGDAVGLIGQGVAGADEGQRLVAVEVVDAELSAPLGEVVVQIGRAAAGKLRDAHVHPADRVGHGLEASQIDRDEMIDLEAGQVLQRAGEPLDASVGQDVGELVLPVMGGLRDAGGNGHEGVPGK